MTAFLNGLLIGLGFIIFIGPVLFTLLKNTLQSGFWAGFFVALGIVIGDLLAVVICSFGAIPFFKAEENQYWLGILGSIILVIMGLKFLIFPETKQQDPDCEPIKKITKTKYLSFFTQGFLINFINPFVFVVWIGLIGYAQSQYGYNTNLFLFLGATLLGIFAADLTKVYFAQKIKRFMTPIFLKRLYRIFGIILIIFGLRTILYVMF